MEVQEIKYLCDIVLAYQKKQKLIDKQGMYYDIVRIASVQNVPMEQYKITYKRGVTTYIEIFDEYFISRFKIVLTNNKENKMEGYIQRMIQEHKELVARIEKLNAWVYGDAYKTVHPSEFANECVQLKAMKVYEEALRARLFNAGVKIANGEYLVAIDTMNEEPEDGDTPDND